MSDSDTTGFGKLIPGFDFFQKLAKGASANFPQMPNMANWVTPTLNVEELDKRIGELKNVQFWLEQNSRALAATVQALEVQKMTLATLKGMNMNLADMANAFKPHGSDSASANMQQASDKAAAAAKSAADVASGVSRSADKDSDKAAASTNAMGGMVDPLQLWGALTQQFQQIASNTLKEVTGNAAETMSRSMGAGMAKKTTPSSSTAGKKTAAKKTSSRKPAAKKTTRP